MRNHLSAWMASLWAGVLYLFLMLSSACVITNDGGDASPSVYYGPPPPDDGSVMDTLGYDTGTDACEPMAYYGPAPCTDTSCLADYGAGWYCDENHVIGQSCGHDVVWPTCVQGTALDAGIPDRAAVDIPAVYYGPVQVDAGLPDLASSDTPAVYYGPVVVDGSVPDISTLDECQPLAWYGPAPCSGDSCANAYGAGWYCDENHVVGENCGQPVTWPTCVQGTPVDAGSPDIKVDSDGPPPVYYGPVVVDGGGAD